MTEPLNKVLQEFGERAVRQEPPTLQGLVNKWASFVEEVENGYRFSIYDYTNDLSVRDLLAELLGRVDRSTQVHARQLLQKWDERFRFATRTMPETLAAAPLNAGWWWQRIPRDVKGELKEDLKTGMRSSRVKLKLVQLMTYTPPNCGPRLDDLPDFAFDQPSYALPVPPKQRTQHVHLESDLCVVNDEHY